MLWRRASGRSWVVDHGKTSILDFYRKTNVVSGEAGASPNIGAYQVQSAGGKLITFLDTPPSRLRDACPWRQRHRHGDSGGRCNDGIMPQTEEAIAHAKAANVPLIAAA